MSSPTPRRPVAPAAQPKPLLPQTNLGQLPLKPAQVYISEETSQQLQAIGWQPGDVVPEGLPEAVDIISKKFATQKAAADAEVAAVGAANRLKITDPVDIRSLPPAAIAELTNFMQQAKNWQQQQTQNASMRPGVTQGLAAAEKAAGVSKTEFLVDTAPPRAPAAPQPAVSQTAPLTFEEAAPEPPPAPVETPAASEVGAASEKHECDRCGWDRRVPFNIEATEEDIRGFCVAVLSGKRFYKRVPLFDGRLAVTFRTLSSYEGQLVFTQLRYDVENRVVTTDVEYLARMSIYRLMLGTESIVRADNSEMIKIPELKKIGYEKPAPGTKQTELVQLHDWFLGEEGIEHEDLLRLLGREHERFQRLQEMLEARTADPNFWKGIG